MKELFNNMILAVILYAIMIALLVVTYTAIHAIAQYFVIKREALAVSSQRESANFLQTQLENTNHLIALIDSLIDFAARSRFKEITQLNQRYNFVNYDKDIEAIASTVYNYLRKDFTYETIGHLIEKEGMMDIIISRTEILILDAMQQYNNTLPTQQSPLDGTE